MLYCFAQYNNAEYCCADCLISVIMMIVVPLSKVIMNVDMHRFIMESVVILCVVMQSVIMLRVVMPSVIMLIVAAPASWPNL